jgi:phosphoribosylformylglycinamidine synthase
MQNASRKFICREVPLKVERAKGTSKKNIRLPIAHADGNYFADEETLRRIEGEGQVVLRYLDNPNGSRNDIAGLRNAKGNVVGMMPHPERAAEPVLGNEDGLPILRSFLEG